MDLGHQFFSRAVAIDPKLAEAYVGIATVYSERFWNGWGGGAENLTSAEASFDSALQLDADNMRARRGLGFLEFYRGDTEGYLRLIQQAALVGPDDIETLMARAEAYTLSGLDVAANRSIRQILELDPQNQFASWLLVLNRGWAGDFEATAAAAGSSHLLSRCAVASWADAAGAPLNTNTPSATTTSAIRLVRIAASSPPGVTRLFLCILTTHVQTNGKLAHSRIELDAELHEAPTDDRQGHALFR